MTGNNDKINENEAYMPESMKRIFDVYEPIICKHCNKSFEKRTHLTTHLKTHEFDDHVYESNKNKLDKYKPYVCNVCEKRFTAKKNLLKHLRVIHKDLNEAEKLQVKKTRCPETNCLFTCRKMRDLRNHIEKYHEIKILKDTLHFTNEEGFLKWKKEEEDNSVASFVSFRRRGILSNGTVKKILLCHRTGKYNPKGKGKHRLKSHGSCKIGGTCPAAMEIIQCPDGQVTVSYYKTHLGHSQDVIHLPLSKQDRAKLSERIEQGFSLDAILKDIKESIDPETGKTKRIHLLSRKDLYNIMQSCNNKKLKNNLKAGMQELFLKVKQGAEMNSGPTTPASAGLKKTREHGFQPIAPSPLKINNGESYTGTELLQSQAPMAHLDTSKSTPQLVIVSPGVSYKSLAEVILFHPTDNVTPQTVKPSGSVPNAGKKIIPKVKNTCAAKKISKPDQKCDKKTTAKSPLILKLQDKIKTLCDFLPKSHFLTPKQYETVSGKLDSIIDVYNSINVKTRSRKLDLKNTQEKKSVDPVQENKKVGIECIFTAPQNVVQQQAYEAPFYAYVCNYN